MFRSIVGKPIVEWTLGQFFPKIHKMASDDNKIYEDGLKRFHLTLEGIPEKMGTDALYKVDA